MSEEVKIKISQPMFEVGELERFDSNIHSIVEEYSKMLFKEKDQILTQRIIMKQEEEIERLKIIEEKYKDSQLYIKDFKDEIERLNNIIDKAIEYHNNCIENLDLDKIDDNEKLAYKVAYGIHNNYLKILKGE